MANPQNTISNLSNQQVLLLLIGVDGSGVSTNGISGITRLQKFLFLLWKEAGIQEVDNNFKFKPYKAGPYSQKLYDDLELLENLGFVHSEVQGEATEAEAAEIEELSFEHLMGDCFNQSTTRAKSTTSDTFEERRYTLTKKGVNAVELILSKKESKPFIDGIRRIKSRFANHSLQDLLYYIYTKYEADGWTAESEIRDKVLAKGKRR